MNIKVENGAKRLLVLAVASVCALMSHGGTKIYISSSNVSHVGGEGGYSWNACLGGSPIFEAWKSPRP